MDTGGYRNELKFLCPERLLFLMENKIRHICKLDPNVKNTGTYVVKSLYFDTYDDQCYYENQAGVDNRKKYRIRTYNDNTDVIKLECKYSRHDRKRKEACRISFQQSQSLINNEASLPIQTLFDSGKRAEHGFAEEKKSQELLQRFLIEKRMNLLVPKIIVEYRRTPYIFAGGNVRITFDRTICASSQVTRFFEKSTAFESILPKDVHILEVKYDDFLPRAILELLTAGCDLERTSFSKYALCREYSDS